MREGKILNLLNRIYDKQDGLSKITCEEIFKEFSNSELHVIEIIGKYKDTNGIELSRQMGITPGGISKIISKIRKKGLIESYKKEGNKKEVYYRLTDRGETIYDKHKKAHEDWEKRELIFLETISPSTKDEVLNFLIDYDQYLEKIMKERS